MWFFISLIVLITFGLADFLVIIVKKSRQDPHPFVINFIYYIVIIILSLILLVLNDNEVINNKHLKQYSDDFTIFLDNQDNILLVSFFSGLTFVGANYCSYSAYRLSPNPSFVELINGFSSIVILLFSVILFSATYHVVSIIGILMSFVGLYYLTLKKVKPMRV